MRFIGKHIHALIGVLLLTGLVGAAAGLYFDLPGRLRSTTLKGPRDQTYTCPMHPDVVRAKPGDCPKCGMALVSSSVAEGDRDQCGNKRAHQPGCCSDKSAAQPAMRPRLPPGHPPIRGQTVDPIPSTGCALSSATGHASH